MKVLIILSPYAPQFLVKVEDESHQDEIRYLIRSRKRKKAIDVTLKKGYIIKRIPARRYYSVDADLTLTKCGAYWNLV